MAMETLMLVFRSSMITDVEKLLEESGIVAYTLINNAQGKGITGSVVGSFFYPGTNSVIFAVLPSEQVETTANMLRKFHSSRLKDSRGQPIPFKLYSFPCREIF